LGLRRVRRSISAWIASVAIVVGPLVREPWAPVIHQPFDEIYCDERA
jgi:hypothetical protein